MGIKNKLDVGQLLTIAGCVATLIGSIVANEQQKQANHEIAREVADILRNEMKKGEL